MENKYSRPRVKVSKIVLAPTKGSKVWVSKSQSKASASLFGARVKLHIFSRALPVPCPCPARALLYPPVHLQHRRQAGQPH